MSKIFSRIAFFYAAIFVGTVVLGIIVAALLVNIVDRKEEEAQFPMKVVDIGTDELDAAVWGKNFPMEYDRFMKTEENYGETKYGGSEPYSKLERYPALVRLWAGYAFSKDHNEERGHFYSQIDQENTQRVKIAEQPGACINCHAGDVPQLIEELGWEEFNHTPYNDLVDRLTVGSTCSDCHDPETMELRITRPAFINAMTERGIDLEKASRQEMRTYVCAQCHVEYYFAGENKVLTFPWSESTTSAVTIDNIQAYYEEVPHKDWAHAETGASMLKMQHPEYEMWSTGIHARSGVSCADCHMPYMRVGGVKISDHWLRSPLTNVNQACGTCHNWPEDELKDRITDIQDTTASLLRRSEEALLSSQDAIVAAKEAGLTDEDLAEAYELQKWAQMRWDFVSSENSTGFHSPQEAARILAECIDLTRQAELSVAGVMAEKSGSQVRK